MTKFVKTHLGGGTKPASGAKTLKKMIMEKTDTAKIRKVRIMAPAMFDGKDLNPEFGDLADDAIRGDHCWWITVGGVLWKVTWAENRASFSLLDANGNDVNESARTLEGRVKETVDEWRGQRPRLLFGQAVYCEEGVTRRIEFSFVWA